MWSFSFLGNALRIVSLSMLLLFPVDFVLAISYFARRVVGGFICLLLCFDNPYTICFLSMSLTYLLGYVRAHCLAHVPLGPVLGVYFTFGVYLFLLSLIGRRVRELHSGRESEMSILDIYGLYARRAGRDGCFSKCFGLVGTLVGFLCGVLLLPFAWLFFCFQ